MELDEWLQTERQSVLQVWPDLKEQVPQEISPYWQVRDDLCTQGGILFKGDRALIPVNSKQTIQKRLLALYLGIEA